MNNLELSQYAQKLRLDVLEDVYRAKGGAIGGMYSAIDLFVYLYYGDSGLNIVNEVDRDHFILGKGHASLAVFHIWKDKGWLPKEWLQEYGMNGGHIGEQMNLSIPYAEYGSGSLGHAIGIAIGYALADRIDGKKHKSVAFVGDGECAEGSIWEAVAFAGSEKISDVICVVDYNELGATDVVAHEGGIDAMAQRFQTFGWNAIVIDGHDFSDIDKAFNYARDSERPVAIIAKTIKGKGVSFMENGVKWHNSVPSENEYILAKKELLIG